jgi:hypothetical protein
MTPAAWISFASFAVLTLTGIARALIKLGAIETQLALLWAWYLAECGPGIPGGRRRTDPPASYGMLDPRPPGGGLV